MGCVARAQRALEGTAGVQHVTFEPESERFLVTVSDGFRFNRATTRVRRAGEEHARQLKQRGSPWVLRRLQ